MPLFQGAKEKKRKTCDESCVVLCMSKKNYKTSERGDAFY